MQSETPDLTDVLVQAPDLVTPAQQACGVVDPGAFCTWVFEQTGSEVLSRLAGQIIPGALRILLIVVLAWVALRLLHRVIRTVVPRFALEGTTALRALRRRARPSVGGAPSVAGPLDRRGQRVQTIVSVLQSISTATVTTIALLMVLDVFGVNLGPLLAGLGIVGVALGFGAQSLVKDLLSGTFMLLEDQFGVGDLIDVGEATGVVEAVNLRATRLRDVEGTVWHVPNGQILRVANKSQLWARSLIAVGVASETDIDRAMEVIKATADELWHDEAYADDILEEPAVWGVEPFGPNEVVIRMALKVQPPGSGPSTASCATA